MDLDVSSPTRAVHRPGGMDSLGRAWTRNHSRDWRMKMLYLIAGIGLFIVFVAALVAIAILPEDERADGRNV